MKQPTPPLPPWNLTKISCFAIMALALSGCSSTRVVGNNVYQTMSFPSAFGPYQKLVVVYPLGQTNQQRIIQFDSNAGPGTAMFGAGIRAAGFWLGMKEADHGTDVSVRNSSTGGSQSVTGGNVNSGDQNVDVNAPGSR